jgi:hypothetical protein
MKTNLDRDFAIPVFNGRRAVSCRRVTVERLRHGGMPTANLH